MMQTHGSWDPCAGRVKHGGHRGLCNKDAEWGSEGEKGGEKDKEEEEAGEMEEEEEKEEGGGEGGRWQLGHLGYRTDNAIWIWFL